MHALGDLDGDGDLDLGAADSGSERISVHLNQGDATFEEAGVFPGARRFTDLEAGDVDGDGDLDLVATDVSGGVSILRNRGAAVFEAPVVAATLLSAPRGFLIEDFDEDGRSDLVTWSPLMLLLSRGEEGFEAVGLAALDSLGDVAAADLDRDGDLDLAASGVDGGDSAILFNLGRGAFAAPVRLGCCGSPGPVTAGDLDLDSDVDLVLAGLAGGELTLMTLLQGRNGEFRLGPLPIARGPSDSLLAVDLSGDAYPDVVATVFVGGLCPVCPTGIAMLLLNQTTPPAHSDDDHDGVPDACEGKLFHRGDANVDGGVDLSDAVFILGYLFLGGAPPICADAADPDDDGRHLLTDAVYVLNFLFLGGNAPPSPGPPPATCGADTDPPDHLGCEAYDSCASPQG
jgi:hypothetical protein